jgi:hypothetical protein
VRASHVTECSWDVEATRLCVKFKLVTRQHWLLKGIEPRSWDVEATRLWVKFKLVTRQHRLLKCIEPLLTPFSPSVGYEAPPFMCAPTNMETKSWPSLIKQHGTLGLWVITSSSQPIKAWGAHQWPAISPMMLLSTTFYTSWNT